MPVIRSPLGALGALMVFLEAIATSALIPLQGQPELQKLIVLFIIASISAITVTIIFVVVWITIRRPGLLFNPQDIDPTAHVPLYAPDDTPRPVDSVPGLSITVEDASEPEEK